MADIILDNRAKVNITAIKGDTLAPVSFIFKDTITEVLEDFTGATVTGAIYNVGSDNSIRDLTIAELSLDSLLSKITLQMDANTTAGLDKIMFKIRKVIGNVSTTRVTGIITFNN